MGKRGCGKTTSRSTCRLRKRPWMVRGPIFFGTTGSKMIFRASWSVTNPTAAPERASDHLGEGGGGGGKGGGGVRGVRGGGGSEGGQEGVRGGVTGGGQFRGEVKGGGGGEGAWVSGGG